MRLEEFLKQEYITLREEIKETKSRIFKLTFGMLAVPAAYILGGKITINISSVTLPVLVFIIPVIIIILALLFTAESRALMRAGRYIKEQIEPRIAYSTTPNNETSQDKVIGWEEWLEGGPTRVLGPRMVDKLVFISFYVLFVIYYISSVVLASISLRDATVDQMWITIYNSAFFALFLGFAVIFFASFGHSTSTKG